MNFGINIGFLTKKLNIPMTKAAEYVSGAGFTMLDYTPPVMQDDWKSIMKEDCRIFAANGLSVHQTHAPYNRYGSYGDKHGVCMDRCIEATAFMGADYVAIHGDEADAEKGIFEGEAALSYNHNYFLPYLKKAEQMGVKLAFETVFEDSPVRKRFTANPEDLMALILSFKSDHAVCCWDFGHAHVSFPGTAAEWIEKFGLLIQCTHVHDNTGKDAHQLPMTGDIDWVRTMEAFRKIQYKGILSIEYSHGSMPHNLLPAFLSMTYSSVKHLDMLYH